MNAIDPWFAFALAALGTWRVTHLLAEEDGPADLILKLRSKFGTSVLGTLMDCFQCLSLWIAIPFTFIVTGPALAWIPVWLAVSGAACLLERLGSERTALQVEPSHFPENNHDMLRSGQDSTES
ncbi:MAG TPA: DUF1360 domain-containing protein [Rhodanobacteraceae bacterium]|nr:DUF1360 domain-containing protein [Rhodanobacteraceae bacterium]